VTPNAGVVYQGGKGTPFWFVRMDGSDFQLMLIVQTTRKGHAEHP